jgi:hypothetical protein
MKLILALQNSVFIVVSSYQGGEAWGTHLGCSWVAVVSGNWHAIVELLALSSLMVLARFKGWNEPGLAQTGHVRCPEA